VFRVQQDGNGVASYALEHMPENAVQSNQLDHYFFSFPFFPFFTLHLIKAKARAMGSTESFQAGPAAPNNQKDHKEDHKGRDDEKVDVDRQEGGGMGLNLFGQRIKEEEDAEARKKRHDNVLLGYRIPQTHWQAVSKMFVYESAFNLATSDCCMAIFTVKNNDKKEPGATTNVTVLYNRRINLGPKDGITYDNWPKIWNEFQNCGFMSIVCANSKSADEYCYRVDRQHHQEGDSGFWFWHLDRRPKDTNEPKQQQENGKKSSVGLDTKHVGQKRSHAHVSESDKMHPESDKIHSRSAAAADNDHQNNSRNNNQNNNQDVGVRTRSRSYIRAKRQQPQPMQE